MNTCRVCGSTCSQALFRSGELGVRRCRACTHVYLDVNPDKTTILKMYADYGKQGQSRYFSGVDPDVLRHLDEYLHRCKNSLRGRLEPTLLDVGCGSGVLLLRAAKLGFKCTGIEICQPLALLARERARCHVYQEFLLQLSFPTASFDVVTMYDLIEHLSDPRVDVREIFRILKPGGIFFALTPNNDALVRRISRMLYRASFHQLKAPIRRLYYSDHLSYFTFASLSSLLKAEGFTITSLESANQELSRLLLSRMERVAVESLFFLSAPLKYSKGKLIVYARKPELSQ